MLLSLLVPSLAHLHHPHQQHYFHPTLLPHPRHFYPRCAAAADDAPPPPPPPTRAVDLARELFKYSSSARLRLITSAPVRLPLGVVAEARNLARRFTIFYATVLERIPLHQLLLALMLGCYLLQQVADFLSPRASARSIHRSISSILSSDCPLPTPNPHPIHPTSLTGCGTSGAGRWRARQRLRERGTVAPALLTRLSPRQLLPSPLQLLLTVQRWASCRVNVW